MERRPKAPLIPWFHREFRFDVPIGAAPSVVERLRGTPARLEERLRGCSPALVRRRIGDRWSIQENAGHLWDLEPLWLGRVEDVVAGRAELRAADLENRQTHSANHNGRPLAEVLGGFRAARAQLVQRLEAVDDASWRRAALHPRLRVPMRLLDLSIFVAEHDDHHLATITALLLP
jgi:uncharacterized damage-inducible protein DinB